MCILHMYIDSLKIVCFLSLFVLINVYLVPQTCISFNFVCSNLLLIATKCTIFSSPELKAQVSFSDYLSSGVCPSVRPSVRLSVCLSVCLSVNFSYFQLLLQNHWANLNQIWHRPSLGEGD